MNANKMNTNNSSSQSSKNIKYSNRYDLLDIQFPTLWELYEKQRDAFWVVQEVDLTDDIQDWRLHVTEEERRFLIYILAFFAQADGLVLQNLQTNFSLDIPIPEFSAFYGIQAGIEAIHWEMYSKLIDTFITNREEKMKVRNAIQHYPCIREKAKWIDTWMNNERAFPERLIAFACTEGISFSASFCGIFYFKKKGVLPGLVVSNMFISRDEGMHRDFGIEAFKQLQSLEPEFENEEINKIIRECKEITQERIYEIVKSCVEVEKSFVEKSLECELIGISSDQMNQYVEFVADHLLKSLGVNKIYNSSNPFDWMDMISMENKANFFEGRVTEYRKSGKAVEEKMEYDFDADF